MDTFERELNELLIQTFRDILKVEELILERSAPRLSVSEVHLIEAIRKSKDRALTVSEIASELDIAVPSATVAVNKLVKKVLLRKKRVKKTAVL